ncbi:MAG: DUF4422 domain-containing protein [Lachnospiraceae bacterium]|nr:DUF4422 domain-containing protein [Lachnospiraceae bacterium]MBO5146450.1 DUF4422 domain-containing protein [Lachnospiraceae bacterium]
MDLAIYGAQGIALGAYEAIHGIYPQRRIRCFLITEREMNAEYLSGIPVLELKSFAGKLSDREKENMEILIATPENVMPEIEECLDKYGLYCHVRLTSSRWTELIGYHCACDKNYIPLSALPVGYHRPGMHVFMAKFYKDKPLSADYNMPEWITPIQVGASLCEKRVANILDCDGENISEKNGNYSELTALYWIWKNRLSYKNAEDNNEFYGLTHYRRILQLSEDDILRLADNDVDVVLPFPMPYEPDIGEHHKRYLKAEDWNALVKALEEIQPEYALNLPEVLQQRYFYNYNMMLARKKILADYCEWLFPILERIEELSIPKGCERKDRYIGYMAETLATLYFMLNKDRLTIVHAGYKFLT